MTIDSRSRLIDSLTSYQSTYSQEQDFRVQFLELLTAGRCFHRDHLPGHITGSAWILNPSRNKVLLVHHMKLNRWLQPGGHADGDENIAAVALREAEEETGLDRFAFAFEGLFDIDIHPIPARGEFPEHLHYDIRFALQTDEHRLISRSDESFAVAWVPFEKVPSVTDRNESILRMMEKSVRLP